MADAEPMFVHADGYAAHYVHYATEARIRGCVVALHGIQSHAGWYDRSCKQIAAAGYETYFLERRGSGRNQQDRGHCRGYKQLCGDVGDFVDHIRSRHPGLPVILLGISWGGKLAVAALKLRPDLVDGLLLLAPGWFAKVQPTLHEKLAIGWSFLLWPRRRIRVPLSDPALFTGNPVWQEFLRDDPLSVRRATARLLMTSRILDRVIDNAPSRISVPSLLVLAGQDRIIDNQKVRAYFERFAAKHRQVLEYPASHHTFEFEPNPEPIFRDIVAWMLAHWGPANVPAEISS